MIIGVFSDAHGNETGFFKCLDFLRNKAEKIFFLGDACGYFPFSNRIIEALRDNNIVSLKGNHDAMLLGELDYPSSSEHIYQVKRSREEADASSFLFLKELPSSLETTIDGRKLLFVHGSPANPLNGYVYPDTAIENFAVTGYDVIFMGHTHRPFIKENNGQLLVNVGSCGLPRDIGNRLTVVLYDTDKYEATLQEIEMYTDDIIRQYEGRLHPSVKDVLNRNHKNYGS